MQDVYTLPLLCILLSFYLARYVIGYCLSVSSTGGLLLYFAMFIFSMLSILIILCVSPISTLIVFTVCTSSTRRMVPILQYV